MKKIFIVMCLVFSFMASAQSGTKTICKDFNSEYHEGYNGLLRKIKKTRCIGFFQFGKKQRYSDALYDMSVLAEITTDFCNLLLMKGLPSDAQIMIEGAKKQISEGEQLIEKMVCKDKKAQKRLAKVKAKRAKKKN